MLQTSNSVNFVNFKFWQWLHVYICPFVLGYIHCNGKCNGTINYCNKIMAKLLCTVFYLSSTSKVHIKFNTKTFAWCVIVVDSQRYIIFCNFISCTSTRWILAFCILKILKINGQRSVLPTCLVNNKYEDGFRYYKTTGSCFNVSLMNTL